MNDDERFEFIMAKARQAKAAGQWLATTQFGISEEPLDGRYTAYEAMCAIGVCVWNEPFNLMGMEYKAAQLLDLLNPENGTYQRAVIGRIEEGFDYNNLNHTPEGASEPFKLGQRLHRAMVAEGLMAL